MRNHFDVVVVGLGGWGSATLRHLAAQGLKVAGVEQYAPAHDRGSSHGETRIIRMAYFLHPDYVPLLRRAYVAWRELEQATGRALLTQTGLVCLGEADGTFIRGLERCYATHHLPHERFGPEELHRRYRAFHPPEDAVCYFDPLGGFLRVEDGVRACLGEANRLGAVAWFDEPVTGWQAEVGGVTVRTAQRVLQAERLVLCAGAFADPSLLHLGCGIAAKRKATFWYRTGRPEAFAVGAFPCWIAKLGGRDFYGFPSVEPGVIKAAEDSGGEWVTDPRTVGRQVSTGDESNLRPFLGRLFPGLVGETVRSANCLYELSPDRHFVLDRHPHEERVFLGLGGSGHGYKFSPIIGELLAGLVMGKPAGSELALFKARRLEAGACDDPASPGMRS